MAKTEKATAETIESEESSRYRAAFPVVEMRAAMEELRDKTDDGEVLHAALDWALHRLPEGGAGRRTETEEEKEARLAMEAAAEEWLKDALAGLTPREGQEGPFGYDWPSLFMSIIPEWLAAQEDSEGIFASRVHNGYRVPLGVIEDGVEGKELQRHALMGFAAAERVNTIERVPKSQNFRNRNFAPS